MIYVYLCQNDKCQNEFELNCPMKKEPKITKCPKCKKKAKKIPAAVARMKANWSQWNAT